MKKYMLYLLLAAILWPLPVFAEEGEMGIEDAEEQLEMLNIQLEQERAKLDFEFEREMRTLEIEKARLEIENAHRQLRGPGRHHPQGPMCIILLIAILNRILAPIWIYKDMRKRDESSVILVLFGILGGLAGLLTYALIRIADVKATTTRVRK